jgi:hypothetical protein
MNHFADVLQRTSDRLDLPQPARSRVLLEIAADIEDSYALHLKRGLDEETARREAIESFDLSDETLAELARVHCGPVRRVLDHLSAGALRFWERLLLGALCGVACYVGGWMTQGIRIFLDAGPFAWPVLLTAVAALLLSVAKFYRLFLKQDHYWRHLQRGLVPLLGLAVLMMFLGFTGSWLEVWRLANEAEGGDTHLMVYMMRWALQTTALLQLSLGLALLSALAWFGLAGKVGRIERHEAELLFRAR